METIHKAAESWARRHSEMRHQELLLAAKCEKYRTRVQQFSGDSVSTRDADEPVSERIPTPDSTNSPREHTQATGENERPSSNNATENLFKNDGSFLENFKRLSSQGVATHKTDVLTEKKKKSQKRSRKEQIKVDIRIYEKDQRSGHASYAAVQRGNMTNISRNSATKRRADTTSAKCDTVYKRLMMQNRAVEKIPPFCPITAPNGKLESVIDANRRYVKERIYM